jgi:type IV secretion system protein VirB10
MVNKNNDFKFDDNAADSGVNDESLSNDTPAVAALKNKNTVIVIAVSIIILFFVIKSITKEDPNKLAAEQAASGKTIDQEIKPAGKVAGEASVANLQATQPLQQQEQIALPPPPPPPPAFEPASIYAPAKDESLPPLPTVTNAQGQNVPKLGEAGIPSLSDKSGIFAEENKQRLSSGMFVGGSGGGIGGGRTADDPLVSGKLTASSAASVVVTTIGSTQDSIVQGKVLDAVLETAINTDLPGSLRAIVSRDVYAESGRRVLIPKGTRLIGSYKTDVKIGQARVYIIWSRIIRPDGVDAMLDSQAIDLLGRSGVLGEVDNKFFEIFSSSILLSAITIGFAIAADSAVGDSTVTQGETGSGDATTSGSVAATSTQAAIADFGSTVKDITQKLINVTPRITVDQGTQIKVFVNRDIKFPPEYFNNIKLIY